MFKNIPPTDIRLPGMLTATVIHPPVFGAKIKSVNRETTLSLPGVKAVIPVETGLALVAESFWQARVAMERTVVEWEAHELERVDSEQLFKRWAEIGRQEGKSFYESGRIDEVITIASTVLEAAYDLPYQVHATPEPMNFTADVREDSCQIWVPTQNQKGAQEIAARITGLDNAAIAIHKNAAGSLAGRYLPGTVSGKKAIVGAGPLPYAIENMRVEFIDDDPGIPTCWWRSVAHSSNCFAVECFIDEIAAAAGRDPFELRCDLLVDCPRLLKVVQLAAEKAAWHQKPAGEIHRGLACHDFQNTMMAIVAEVSVFPNGHLRVHRVACAVDCGVAVNPKTIAGQVQSAVVFGLTAAIKSEITIKNGVTQQSNFDDFPILRFDEMPVVDTHIVSSNLPPTGIGEVAVPLIGPAVANAVFAATGKRIRKLPIRPVDLAGDALPLIENDHEKAGMFANVLSGFNILDESDIKELNITTRLRRAGEAVMFPTALLASEYKEKAS
jgi:isoquinoline 1-oxidoreductase subunit beta